MIKIRILYSNRREGVQQIDEIREFKDSEQLKHFACDYCFQFLDKNNNSPAQQFSLAGNLLAELLVYGTAWRANKIATLTMSVDKAKDI